MQKMYLVDEKTLLEVSLSVPLTAGDFCVLDTAANVNISCSQEVEKVESIGLRGEVPAGEMFTVGRSEKELYRVVESLAAGFTAVAKGIFSRICREVVRIAEKFRREKMVPVRCRMAKLAFAGGLRL